MEQNLLPLPSDSIPSTPSSQGVSPKQPAPLFASHGYAGHLPTHYTPHSPIVFAFPPNRDTLGGTAYFIVENGIKILVDCPAWNDSNRDFLTRQGGVDWLILTHRDGIGRVKELYQTFNCQILIHEQEAYLLPGIPVTTFGLNHALHPDLEMIWTPGYSPGSACLYYSRHGGMLFSGRHLLPNPQGKLALIKTAKTFHQYRQVRSLKRLVNRFSPHSLRYICPGANTGFLRGQRVLEQAYAQMLSVMESLGGMGESGVMVERGDGRI